MSEVGEVVPAREGLRQFVFHIHKFFKFVGEVVPAREGLRPIITKIIKNTTNQSEKWFQQEKD